MLLPNKIDKRLVKFIEDHGYVRISGDDSRALARRNRLLVSHNIDLVIDVGANSGQYGTTLRSLGYAGRIVSFEPMREAWLQLKEFADSDPEWQAIHMGLAEEPGELILNVAENSVSSSVLNMLPVHERHAPKSGYLREETISVSSLDSIFSDIRGISHSIWLKIDVQGFEDRVLEGAKGSLSEIEFVQIELSLTRLYENQLTYLETCRLLDNLGFDLVGIEPGFLDKSTGILLQFDGVFRHRRQ